MSRLLCTLALLLSIGLAPSDDKQDTVPPLPKDDLPEVLVESDPANGFSNLPAEPDDNPSSADKIALGRRLFFDPILSADNTIACASCHRPDQGFANREKIAIGIQGKVGTRNVPTVLNRGYGKHFAWDGKSSSLEDQVLTPIENPNELGNTVEAVLAALRQDDSYVQAFSKVFNGSKLDPECVNEKNLAKSIAAFERVLIYADTKVDRFRSSEYTALSREARQGMWLFESRGGCWKCHGGENFSDEKFHNTGVGFGVEDRDTGRYGQTNQDSDKFKFKTPTLRGVEFTAPYMHDGSVATLKEVVEFYNRGGAPKDPAIDSDMQPLNLTAEEIGFLVEFLKALSQ